MNKIQEEAVDFIKLSFQTFIYLKAKLLGRQEQLLKWGGTFSFVVYHLQPRVSIVCVYLVLCQFVLSCARFMA